MHRLLLMCCISTVLTISEAANVGKRDEQCAVLEECPSYTLGLEVLAYLSLPDGEQYEQLCRKNDDLQKCFDDNKDDCEDEFFLAKVMRGPEALNFICSAEGKEGLDSISDSPCVNDQTTLLSAKKGCTKSVHFNSSLSSYNDMSFDEVNEHLNVCSYLDQEKTCILESLKNRCGQNFGNFAKKLVDIYYQPSAEVLYCD
ncbi:uncharacterized protein LOC106067902 [Biomphalaria glabrata]|uniref:Uncharacterized protein LOC106067902 n=1 Tax=Biomphalaria glabrata TaxID=6526 RepID=A0A9W3BEU3_BIOGL|nr:uncharacterized protein LOC106067902 [Biomphalaria glabrata]